MQMMTTKESVEQVKQCVRLKESFIPINESYSTIIKALEDEMEEQEIQQFYHDFAQKAFTTKRVKVSNHKFYEALFGKNASYYKPSPFFKYNHEKLITLAVDEVLERQKEAFIKTNRKEMDLRNDTWVLYFLKGPSLNKREFDFRKIKSKTLRNEAKIYFKHILYHENNFRNDKGFALVVTGLNLFTTHYSDIHYVKDIEELHGRFLITILQTDEIKSQRKESLSVNSIRKMVQKIGMIAEHLRHQEKYAMKPLSNPFENIVFHNVDKMSKNTEIIPEEVGMQLDEVYHELNDNYRLLFEILTHTGLRIKEVSHLKQDCIQPSKTSDEYMLLTYTPYKILNELKKKSKSTTAINAIRKELAVKIQEQIRSTIKQREQTDTDYIFFTRKTKNGERYSLIQENSFVQAVNRLIEDHQICDEHGQLWKYTSRQSRKTIAVELAENGATSQEIARQLGHLDTRTTDEYYAEVRKKKLAELNSKFFKKKFDMFVGEENLALYTEEERRQLYVDFSLNSRDVEFGKCSKHVSEGPCGVRKGNMSCATCSKLCTGSSFLDKWKELVESQQAILDELIRIYEKENITDYEDFIEYKREKHLLNTYQSVSLSIIENR